jgi:hypothetical protein
MRVEKHHGVDSPARKVAGAEAGTISAQSVGLESKKTSGRRGVFFLDPPLCRTLPFPLFRQCYAATFFRAVVPDSDVSVARGIDTIMSVPFPPD